MSESCGSEGSNRLIMACAGSANTGQMTYQLALELTREGQGNLFCLAGIGAHLSGFVKSAREAADMLVLDGCPMACAAKNLEQADIPVRNHLIMTELGVKKQHGQPPDPAQMAQVKAAILKALPSAGTPVFPLAR
jgi:uncharacterized metal-binding protein